ncbi:MAG TPA: macrolide ABC transporter ATP-binding protein [Deltaproteobacteria bacterium]|nr:macrolide ABC transporter ATP-binding protein [Deltaproteobacteria bacterium]
MADSIVQVRDLARTYQQGQIEVHALRGVSLDIAPGEFTALMGPSGSGKTTLLNQIGALDTPTTGSVLIDGQELVGMDKVARSNLRLNRIGFVFQAYNLIPVLTAFENAEFVLMMRGIGPAERKERVMRTLAAVGLEGMEHRLPSELSGGQQQRVAVARAIVGEPALVLADEPTANLDSKTGDDLLDLMKSLNQEQGITFVFATHDPKVMQAAQRVVTLVDGKISEDRVK